MKPNTLSKIFLGICLALDIIFLAFFVLIFVLMYNETEMRSADIILAVTIVAISLWELIIDIAGFVRIKKGKNKVGITILLMKLAALNFGFAVMIMTPMFSGPDPVVFFFVVIGMFFGIIWTKRNKMHIF